MAKKLKGTFVAVTSAAGGTVKGKDKWVLVEGTVVKDPPSTWAPYLRAVDKDGK